MSFGFSVGDFIAALQLVGQVVAALRESGGSGAEYRELIAELYGLERALLAVKQLEPLQEQHVEYLALRHVAAQCQQTIDAFCTTIEKYHRPFQRERSGSSLGTAVVKIQWRLCKKDDLLRFKTDVSAHTQSLQILLSAAQVRQSRLQEKKADEHCTTLAGAIRSGTGQVLEELRSLSGVITQGTIQSGFIMQRTAEIIRFNIFIFHMLCMIYTTVLKLPQQVDRERPVIIFDALGRVAPFHLEFVRSFEALNAVLIANFRNVPSGLRKIENGEFLVQDAATKRVINLRGDWSRCFSPGQRVEMSIVFRWKSRRAFQSPNCSSPTAAKYHEDVECIVCGVVFGSFIEVGPSRHKVSVDQHIAVVNAISTDTRPSENKAQAAIIMPKTAYDETEDIIHYRRVKMVRRISRKVWNSLVQDKQQRIGDVLPVEPTHMASPSQENAEGPHIAEEFKMLDQNLVDHQTFEQILEMDDDDDIGREFSRSIVQGLILDGDRYIEILKESICKMDLSNIEGNAHVWKGHCYSIGIRPLGALCEQLQLFARYARCDRLKIWQDIYGFTGDLGVKDAPEWLVRQLKLIEDEQRKAEKALKTFYRIESWDRAEY
ncbi:hypothetical protein F5Y19DRAFT_412130 [Xylariaceae sp. FL1651]|nr:hypothetical protein F5Y19DRAFT_412130 [Xylariaceae sp. FL1651]